MLCFETEALSLQSAVALFGSQHLDCLFHFIHGTHPGRTGRTTQIANIMRVILLTLMLFVATASSATAKDHIIKYKFDLITKNLKNLGEPKGDFEIVVKLRTGKKSVDNPFTEALLREAATPHLVAAKNWIEQELIAFDLAVTEAKKAKALSQDALNDRIKALNKVYQAIIKQLQLETKLTIKQTWAELQKQNKDLSDWKIDTWADVLKGTISVTRGVLGAAESSGLTLAKDIVDITEDVVSVVGALQKLMQSEEKVRKALKSAIDAIAKPTAKPSKKQKLAQVFGSSPLSTLKSTLKTYENKWTAKRKTNESLSLRLDALLAKQEALTDRTKREKVQKMTTRCLELIEKNNTAREQGASLVDTAKELVELASKQKLMPDDVNMERARGIIGKFKKAYDLYNDLTDPLGKAIDLAIDAGAEGLKALKAK